LKSGCWIWQGKPNQGYENFYMNGKAHPAHRALFKIHIHDVPDGIMVCHKCNNKMCVNSNHLYADSHTNNMNDLRKAKTLAGENNPNYGVICSEEKKIKISLGVKKSLEENNNDKNC